MGPVALWSWWVPASGHGGPPPRLLYQPDGALQGRRFRLDLLDADGHGGPSLCGGIVSCGCQVGYVLLS